MSSTRFRPLPTRNKEKQRNIEKVEAFTAVPVSNNATTNHMMTI